MHRLLREIRTTGSFGTSVLKSIKTIFESFPVAHAAERIAEATPPGMADAAEATAAEAEPTAPATEEVAAATALDDAEDAADDAPDAAGAGRGARRVSITWMTPGLPTPLEVMMSLWMTRAVTPWPVTNVPVALKTLSKSRSWRV